ncbi:MAG: efflux RND transporter periplasmic adaptor subunit [Rikenellaceae bacterium]
MKMTEIIKILPMVAICLLASCSNANKTTKTDEVEKVKVTVEKVSRRAVEQISTFTGSVEAQTVNNIAPQMSVRIGKIYVEIGDKVLKDQKLVELDATNLTQAKIQMENDAIEFERVDELYKFGGVSKSEWDSRKLAYDISKTNYNNINENTVLASPISGIVTARNYDSGDMYSMGQPILVVEQIRPVKLKINVSESLFTKVKKGMEVDITADVYGDEIFKGRVSLIYPSINPNTRTFPVEVSVANRDERIRPGMFARVMLSYGTEEYVVVPDRAVVKQTGSGDRYIYVFKDGKVSYQKIKLGRRMDTEYEIISGIEDGDLVITTGQSRLNNGMEVEILNEKQ